MKKHTKKDFIKILEIVIEVKLSLNLFYRNQIRKWEKEDGHSNGTMTRAVKMMLKENINDTILYLHILKYLKK